MCWCAGTTVLVLMLCGACYSTWAAYHDFTIMRQAFPQMKTVTDQVAMIFAEQQKKAAEKAGEASK